jgi:hypothetical protein
MHSCGDLHEGSGWEFSIFARERPGFRNQCKFLSIKAKGGRGRAFKNVLTAKRGRFLGVLAEKRGVPEKKNTIFFSLFHFFVVFCFASHCPAGFSSGRNPSKKSCLKTYRRF